MSQPVNGLPISRLADVPDVAASSPTAGQALVWDATAAKWVPAARLPPNGDGSQLAGVLHTTGDESATGAKSLERVFTSLGVHAGLTSTGSANGRLESRAGSTSQPIYAGYDSAGTNVCQFEPVGNLRVPAGRMWRTTATAPVAVNDATTFGFFNLGTSNGSGVFLVSLSINGVGNSQAKYYMLVAQYGSLPNWVQATPAVSAAPYNGNDCVLDVYQPDSFFYFRVRRVSGSTPANASLNLILLSDAFAPFAFDGSTGPVTPP